MVSCNFRNNEEKQRFELDVDGVIAYLTYDIVDNVWHLPHTIVPKVLGGQGVGSSLVKQSLDYLNINKINFIPICSFITSFISKNPEYKL
jgi:predicted GNAT family acetyltransferase